MKRFALLAIAVVCAAMFVTSAFADDRVSLSGNFRVRAWDVKNSWFGGEDQSYFDQRLRIGTKINVSDDVSIQMRADYGEGAWGYDYTGGNGLITRPRRTATNTLDIDRAFVDIKKEMWSLRAGQQYLGLGVNKVLDANATGFKFDLNFAPVVTSLIYAKISEDGSLVDDDNTEDQDFYAINVNYTCDAFAGNVFVAAKNDDTDVDDAPVMVGLHGTGKLGMVNLVSELAFATGDTDNGTVDYMGTQFYLEADANVTDAVNVGAELLYALGTDDPTEEQFTTFANWSGFAPMDMNTPMAGDLDGGIPSIDVFDPTGDSAGVQGITLFGKFAPMDMLSLGAKVGYFQPEEDSVTVVDDITSFNVWAAYTIATNTELSITYLYSDPELVDGASDATLDDAEKILVTRLQITF